MDKEYETMIGKVICDILHVEWMRFTMFHTEDRYLSIPMLVFRIKKNDENWYKLLECIDNFEGNAKWVIFQHPFTKKINYILSIDALRKFYLETTEIKCFQMDYFEEEPYKMYCDNAIQDIPLLADYIMKTFNKKVNEVK